MKTLEASIELKADSPEEKETLAEWDQNTEIFVYSGEITPFLFDTLFEFAHPKKKGENVLFVLTTPGGSADAAYRIARYFRGNYDKFTLAVPSDCKSAGTLLACGAHEIVMTPKGEFGPLDVQVFNPDEFLSRNSGLTITQALQYIEDRAFEAWEKSFLKVRNRSSGIITTKTASEIASAISVGIYSQISDKIDPSRVGDLQRSCDVAYHYGVRLGRPDSIIRHLIFNYPSHSFVIDFREAKALFGNVRAPSKMEEVVFSTICDITKEQFDHEIHDRLTDHEDYLIHVELCFPEDKSIQKNNENHKQDQVSHNDKDDSIGGQADSASVEDDHSVKSSPKGHSTRRTRKAKK